MEFYLIIILISAVLVLLILTGSYITYRMTFYRSPDLKRINLKAGLDKEGYKEFKEISEALIDNIIKTPYEDVYITSRDGLRLHGRYFEPYPAGAPLAIECHGYKSSPMRDFSGGGVSTMQLGFNVLMIDQRAHEESEGKVITFGKKEKDDVLQWIEYAILRFGREQKIILQGMSMGAATVLMVSEYRLPDSVVGIVADCPYSSAKEIIKNTIRGMGLPAGPLYPLVRLGGILWGGIDTSKINPGESIKRHTVPILLIHGDGDTFVPHEMSVEMSRCLEADERSSFHSFPGAEHGISYLHDTPRYERILGEFCQSIGVFSEITQ